MDRCPKREIEELQKMIIVDERGPGGSALREHVDHVFDKDMKVMSIRLIPLGLCAEQNTKVHKTPIQINSNENVEVTKYKNNLNNDLNNANNNLNNYNNLNNVNLQNSKESKAAADQNYLVTFVIPAVVVVCMILLAGIVACVLYRRRRTGITFLYI